MALDKQETRQKVLDLPLMKKFRQEKEEGNQAGGQIHSTIMKYVDHKLKHLRGATLTEKHLEGVIEYAEDQAQKLEKYLE